MQGFCDTKDDTEQNWPRSPLGGQLSRQVQARSGESWDGGSSRGCYAAQAAAGRKGERGRRVETTGISSGDERQKAAEKKQLKQLIKPATLEAKFQAKQGRSQSKRAERDDELEAKKRSEWRACLSSIIMASKRLPVQ